MNNMSYKGIIKIMFAITLVPKQNLPNHLKINIVSKTYLRFFNQFRAQQSIVLKKLRCIES